MSVRPFLFALPLALNALCAHAADQSNSPATDSKAFLSSIEGVYKKQFKNGDVEGNSYQSENILEVVPVSDDAAYVKAYLEFFNGHTCSFEGIAVYEKEGTLRFRDPEKEMRCPFTLNWKDNTVSFDAPDEGCNKFCGARGNLNGDQFTMKQKRRIRYMPLILKSEEYKTAVKEYQENGGK